MQVGEMHLSKNDLALNLTKPSRAIIGRPYRALSKTINLTYTNRPLGGGNDKRRYHF